MFWIYKRPFAALAVAIVACASFVPGAVIAQNDGDSQGVLDMSLEELMEVEVVTATKTSQSYSEAPATMYVITEANIQNRGYRNLEDLLEDIPEIEIQRQSVAEQRNHISMRGIAGNEKFIILLDGIRINSTTGTPHVVGSNYSLINAERVEVVLGPASALYGVDAFSGIVNIITKSGDGESGGQVTSSFGTYLSTDNSFVVTEPLGELNLMVAGEVYHSGEPTLPNLYRDDYTWFNDVYSQTGELQASPFAPNVLVNTGNPADYDTPTNSYFVHAKLEGEQYEFGYNRHQESHSSATGMRPEFNFFTPDVKHVIRMESIYGRHVYRPDGAPWSLESSLSRGAFELTPESVFRNTFTNYEKGYKYESGKTVKVEEQFTYEFNPSASIVAGFSYEDIAAIPKTGDLPFPFDEDVGTDAQGQYYLGTDITDANGDTLVIFQDFFNLGYQNYGSYLQLKSEPLSKLQVTVGGRYDYNTRYGSSVSPRVGVVYSASNAVKIKLLYGEAFLAPSPYKAYQHYGGFVPVTDSTSAVTGLFGPFWHLPNPDLKPEQLSSFESSVSYYINRNLSLRANVYYTEIQDLIVNTLEFDQEFKGVAVGAVERAINKGRATMHGGSAGVNAVFSMGSVWCNAFGSYTFSDGDIAGEQLTYSAKHTVKSGIEMRRGKLAVTPRMIYRSKTHQRESQNGVEYANSPYAVVHLYGRYRISDGQRSGTSLFVEVKNLTNKRYYNVSRAQDEGFVATPQDPIRVLGGFTFGF